MSDVIMADTNTNTNSADGVVSDGTQQVDYMLTTIDNPFDPFEQFDEWYAWDTKAGYHTAAFLARITKSSDDLSDADQRAAIQAGIEEIVKENVSGVHKKVSRSSQAS